MTTTQKSPEEPVSHRRNWFSSLFDGLFTALNISYLFGRIGGGTANAATAVSPVTITPVPNVQQVETFGPSTRPVANQPYMSYVLANQSKCNGQPIVFRNGSVQLPGGDYTYVPAAGARSLGSLLWRIPTAVDDVAMVVYWTQA